MTESNAQRLLFSSLGRKKIQADFDGGQITSGAGALLPAGSRPPSRAHRGRQRLHRRTTRRFLTSVHLRLARPYGPSQEIELHAGVAGRQRHRHGRVGQPL